MASIRAIETLYKGYRFRSRLEARWAVFFDTLATPWDYEKEGFDLGGTWYLPDFYLRDLGCYAEVKAGVFTENELKKAQACKCLLLEGVPEVRWYMHADVIAFPDGRITYPVIHLTESVRHKRLWYYAGEALNAYDNTRFAQAVAASRGARFEHGEGRRPAIALSTPLLHSASSAPPGRRFAPPLAVVQQGLPSGTRHVLAWIIEMFKRQQRIDLSRDPMAMRRLIEAAEQTVTVMEKAERTTRNPHVCSHTIALPFIYSDGIEPKHLSFVFSYAHYLHCKSQ